MPPEKKQDGFIWVVYLVWVLLFVASFIAFQRSTPSGSGFLRGFGPVVTFLQFQAGALIAAIFVLWLGWRYSKGSWQRWLSMLPIGLAFLLILAIFGRIFPEI